ncbi:MAG TPA: YSC84-related protein [Dissulfurispiraceae bacterium]|nr:YSC84-related protein [Dissulfurispiraceae bacterium]
MMTFKRIGKSIRLFIVCALFSLICLPALADTVSAATAMEIDVSVDVAMERFYKQVSGAPEFAKAAKALLVMPNVKKGGFFIGGQYGEGALRVGGKTTAYYNLISGSYGITFGAQAMDIIIAFMTDEALRQFQAAEGWEIGVDGNVALIEIGAGTRLDSTTLRDPIIGFVFDVKGLMVDISLKGAKFTRLAK